MGKLLYARLAELCKEKGVSGAKMCADIGVSKSLMTELKKGRKKSVSAETANRLAGYFGVTVAYLLGESDEKIPPVSGEDPKRRAFIKLVNSLSEEQYQAVLQLVTKLVKPK